MGRRKISIKRIADDRNRHVTFIKRNNGLLKKAMELALLCDCEISLVVISDSGKATTFSTSNLGDTFDRVRSNAGVKELNAYSLSDYAKFSNEVADKDDDVVDIPILTSPDAPMYFPAGVTYSSQGDTRATDSLIAAMMLRNEETEHSSSGISIPPSYSSFSNRPVATKPKPVHPPGFTEATKRTHPPAANTTSSEVAVISSGSGEVAHSKEEGDGDNKHDRFDTNSPEVEVATILAASSAGTTPNEGHAMYETAPVRKDRKRPHEAIEENPFLSTRMDYLHPPPSYGQNYYGGHPMMYYPPAHHPPAHHPPPHHPPPHHPPQQGYMMYPPPTEAPAESRPTGTAPLERPSGGSNKQTHRYPPNMMMNHYPMNANMPMHPMGFDPNMQHMMANQYMMAQQANMYNRHPHGGHHGGGAFHSPYVPGDAVEEGESSDVTADV